jgi:S-(hydroxymethyl)glutathione dehydrogenase / alcohol dehydrogenase
MSALRAAVYTGVDVPLTLETLEAEAPRAGEVAVRVEASGLCHSDLHVLMGEWSERPPMVMGHEGCGVVEAVGEGVSHVKPGDRVVLSWFAHCGECARCREGRPWICLRSRANESLMADGGTRLRRSDGEAVRSYLAVGSLAERAVVPATGAVAVPATLPPAAGALIGCAVATGVGAVLNTAAVRPGHTVVVIGCGGVGLSAVMGAALAEAAAIVAVDLSDEKLQLASDVGATHAVRAGEGADAELAAILPDGPDHVFEAIGLVSTIEWAIRLLPPGGTATLVGMTPEDQRISIDPLPFTSGGRTLLGCTYGSCVPERDFPRLATLHLEGRLPIDRLISERIALDDVNLAFDRMRAGDGARRVVVF